MHRHDNRTDPCPHSPSCYTQLLLPPHCHAVCGLPELVSRTHNLICTICNDWRQLCGVLLNIYCREYGKVIHLTRSELPRCEFLVAGTLRVSPFLTPLPTATSAHLDQVSTGQVWVELWPPQYNRCAKSHDSGLCQQEGTAAVWRGIWPLRKMRSALPC